VLILLGALIPLFTISKDIEIVSTEQRIEKYHDPPIEIPLNVEERFEPIPPQVCHESLDYIGVHKLSYLLENTYSVRITIMGKPVDKADSSLTHYTYIRLK
jgi:hypothetical protein